MCAKEGSITGSGALIGLDVECFALGGVQGGLGGRRGAGVVSWAVRRAGKSLP